MILRLATRKDKFIWICLCVQFIVLLTTFYKFKDHPELLVPAEKGLRYFYIPNVMLTRSLIYLLGKNMER